VSRRGRPAYIDIMSRMGLHGVLVTLAAVAAADEGGRHVPILDGYDPIESASELGDGGSLLAECERAWQALPATAPPEARDGLAGRCASYLRRCDRIDEALSFALRRTGTDWNTGHDRDLAQHGPDWVIHAIVHQRMAAGDGARASSLIVEAVAVRPALARYRLGRRLAFYDAARELLRRGDAAPWRALLGERAREARVFTDTAVLAGAAAALFAGIGSYLVVQPEPAQPRNSTAVFDARWLAPIFYVVAAAATAGATVLGVNSYLGYREADRMAQEEGRP
jgi:hypothetical protein